MNEQLTPLEAIEDIHNRLEVEILEGYCRNLPQDIVGRVIDIYDRYGLHPAMETARTLVFQAQIIRQFGL
jgi:hypothetical protein